ncbi:MAG: membrane protein insertase YidC [Caulobacteraceae bacterium]
MQNDSRNTLLFVVLAMAMLVLYQIFVLEPAAKRRQLEVQRAHAAEAAAQPGAPAGALPGAVPAAITVTREAALAATPRTPIANDRMAGSIALKGARIDDLYLKDYRETLDKNSPPVELFRPAGADHAYFADFGWTGTNLPGLPDDQTQWTLAEGSTLSPGHPVVLSYRSPQGLAFTRRIEVDDSYMFTVTDTASNMGAAPVTIAPYATVQRHGLPADLSRTAYVHEGAAEVLSGRFHQYKYSTWKKKGEYDEAATGGWLGINDKYWLAALIPDQREPVRTTFRVTPAGPVDIYDSSFLGQPRVIAPGRQVSVTTHLFAGAKTVAVLQGYQKSLGIPDFDKAIDWGMFWFFTRPIFWLLDIFYTHIGNFGISIMLLTVCVKLLFFYPANKSYESMTKMKKIQPEVEKIRARTKDDPAKLQQETMALYQREKINPFMGCLPIIVQIPVFWALLKTQAMTIEMRHAPFFGWIHDLSARDPTTIWNLFGLIPWDPSHAPLIGALLGGTLHIGAWPIIMAFTMWLSQSMSPTTGMDPTQQKIMQFFPLIFMFSLAQFAAGLVIYWSWNNLLSILQQYVIMRRFKVDNPIDGFLRRVGLGKAAPS